MKKTIDLRQIATDLSQEFDAIDALWLFGSRRHRTRSLRSDIDILVKVRDHVKAGDLRRAIRRHCPALDLFLADGGKAISCMNDSFVEADSFDTLRKKLDAVCIWSKDSSEVDQSAPFEQELRTDVSYIPTALDGGAPRMGDWGQSVVDYFKQIKSERLPTRPFLGETVEEIGAFLLEICQGTMTECERLMARKTRAAWKPSLNSEYDFQDAFSLVVKPWLPELAREEMVLQFDDQEKLADFSLLQGRIVIEMKYIYDKNTKATIAKTLDGLARFYKRNPRVKLLLFMIAATQGADVDAGKWASEFSFEEDGQTVITRVYTVGR